VTLDFSRPEKNAFHANNKVLPERLNQIQKLPVISGNIFVKQYATLLINDTYTHHIDI